MPYIDKNNRKNLAPELNALIKKLKTTPDEKVDGCLNYCISVMLKELYSASYFNYNRMMGVINCVNQEIYRRLVSKYEDEKITEKGDIF
ncbi:MAG: hypothetical protein QME51_04510 [Planctomycetota bacterium]|nr:hypothetical protein [Planctomycetota bacterium]MDI6787613.1 hypothetical protein [Planctomycetota bacterium]